jgi:quercetin dioxygenase-like cupin family protein
MNREERHSTRLVAVVLFSAAVAAGCRNAAPLPDPLEAGWNGRPVCERLHEDESLRILRCTFPPGVGHERHFHAPHFGYVIAGGRMRVTDENGVREVDQIEGASFVSAGVDWHEALNVGETTAVFLIVEPKRGAK